MEDFKKYSDAVTGGYKKQLKDLLMQGFLFFGVDFVFDFAKDLCEQAVEYYKREEVDSFPHLNK